jgi:hypothetical protein
MIVAGGITSNNHPLIDVQDTGNLINLVFQTLCHAAAVQTPNPFLINSKLLRKCREKHTSMIRSRYSVSMLSKPARSPSTTSWKLYLFKAGVPTTSL